MVFAALQPQPLNVPRGMHMLNGATDVHLTENFAEALDTARTLLNERNAPKPR